MTQWVQDSGWGFRVLRLRIQGFGGKSSPNTLGTYNPMTTIQGSQGGYKYSYEGYHGPGSQIGLRVQGVEGLGVKG